MMFNEIKHFVFDHNEIYLDGFNHLLQGLTVLGSVLNMPVCNVSLSRCSDWKCCHNFPLSVLSLSGWIQYV